VTTRPAGRSRGWAGPDQPTPGSAADETPEADPESVAKGIVLRRLTAAPRSRAELAGDLAARGVPDDVATRVLDRFTEVGLVDDQAYARTLVRTRRESRGLARRALQLELRRRGVGDEEAAAALEGLSPDGEVTTAEALVAKRLPSTRGLPHETRVRRLAGLLARKGYGSGLALRVVRDALASEGEAVEGAAEHGATDEGTADEGATEHGAMEHGATDEGAMDEGADHGATARSGPAPDWP
jgi:regulatory protein